VEFDKNLTHLLVAKETFLKPETLLDFQELFPPKKDEENSIQVLLSSRR
jgi:hypothetical protein